MRGRKRDYKRRRYLINSHNQQLLIAFCVGIALFATLLLLAENLYLYSIFMSDEYAGLFADTGILDIVKKDWTRVLLVMAFSAFFMLGLIVGIGVVISNRIVGPIYHMRKHMESILKQEPTGPLKIRKGDFFRDTIDRYNELLKKVRF